MKVSPLAQGTGVPAASDVGNPGRTASPDKLQRAKAIAMGEAIEEVPSTGDPQVDKINQKRIKMKTQMSTNREEPVLEVPVEPLVEESPKSPIVEPTVAEETQPLSPQFAALAKTKRALQVKERELAQREADLKTKVPNLDEYVSKADLKANPLKIFETGITYDQLTEAILNNPNAGSSEIAALKADIQALKEGLDTKFNERDQLSEKQVLSQMKRETDLLTAEGEQFEAIRKARAQQDVVDLIHRTWKDSGEILDVRDAAELVENQLIDEALPFAQIKKLQSRLAPQETPQPEVPKPGTKVMRTLTNRDSARPVASDRRARAIAAFTGQLKRG